MRTERGSGEEGSASLRWEKQVGAAPVREQLERPL